MYVLVAVLAIGCHTMNLPQVGYYNISCLPCPCLLFARCSEIPPGHLALTSGLGGRGGSFASAAAGAGAGRLSLSSFLMLHC